ncbi:LysR family transcriptional regulator [Nannocystis punicea]|uniref:LysR family transcriptional regulator n=1 Tax=Nannocystis punicea TaxID=2995304 RepID=A0ABY7H9P9_9BACT|nr:LysR family transcriptional regulator [Nannocystis poenicansa]WAS95822.1 LysR family transcriptional regulator [Nannocystis poenicansa]
MDSSRLDLNLLVALDALLAERNVTRAARRLHLSQPALSAQLQRLRELLGDPLLIPAQRGMTPTRRALELQAPLHEALEGVRAVLAAGAGFDPATARLTITIAASDYMQYALLMPLAFQLRREAPGVRLAWRALDDAQLAGQAERGEVDLGLITPETAPEQLRSRKVLDERYVVIVRRDHPRVTGAVDLDLLCALDHVVVSPRGGGFTGPTDLALAAHGRERRVVLSVPSFLMVPELVARSDMAALVPARLARDRADRLQLLEPPVPVPGFAIAMVWHRRISRHPALTWFRDRVRSFARGLD